MSLRLVPLALLLGTCSALAFDTNKLGQWGSLFLDDLAPVIAKSARLQQEIDEVLSQSEKKEGEVTCFGMRFPGQWKNLGPLSGGDVPLMLRCLSRDLSRGSGAH